MKVNRWFLFIAMMTLAMTMQAAGYSIKVKINGLNEGDTVLLGNYYGQHQYVKDTMVADASGTVTFKGKEDLPGGIYFIVTPDKKFFEFIVNKEQVMSFESDLADLTDRMKVKGSGENEDFYDYLRFINKQQKLYAFYKEKHTGTGEVKDSAEYYKKMMESVDDSVKRYKIRFIEMHPDYLISKVFKASKDPDIPEEPVLPNGRKDSTFKYRYFKKHYFDEMDFGDDRLLRTPVFYNRLSFYMDKIVVQIPDSIIKEADILIEKGRGNKEVFKYLVWYFTYTYETSKIMGFDAIFVHMVKTYYMTNQCFWVSEKILDNLTKRANKLEPILLGKTAPNMIMQDTLLNLQSLHAIQAKYTVILFWDPECGHCKTEVPHVHEFYLKNRDELGLEVFAVCADTNMAKMKEFIHKNNLHTWINVNGPRALTPPYADLYDIYSTPVIYILDEKKTIIAKRIGYDQIGDFIRNDRKRKIKTGQ